MSKILKCGLTWKIGSSSMRFEGRKVAIIEDAIIRNALFKLGVFERVGDKGLRYIGEIVYADKSMPNKYYVNKQGRLCIDKEGKNEVNFSEIPAEHLAKIDKDFEEEPNA